MLAFLLFADPKGEGENGEDRPAAERRNLTYVLLGLVFVFVFATGLVVFGSGKYGWPVVALVLAGALYRWVFSRWAFSR
jgi:hypothetical protein